MIDTLTQEQRAAVQRFKAAKGRRWRAELAALWARGQDDRGPDGALLRQVRNTIGPSGLARLKI